MKKVIKSIAEISLEELELYKKNGQYSQIVVINDNKEVNQETIYSIEEMIMIKEKVKDITNDIHGKFTEPDYQKKVFTYIYTKLANLIEYDEYGAYCCELGGYEREMTEKFRELAANLYGGLINGKSICSGYSEILRNVLAEVGIESLYISGKEKERNCKTCMESSKIRWKLV